MATHNSSEPKQSGNKNFDAFIKSVKDLQGLIQTIDDLMPVMGDAKEYLNSWEELLKKKSDAENEIFEAMVKLGLVEEDTHTQRSSDFSISDAFTRIEKYLESLRPLLGETISQVLEREKTEDIMNRLLFDRTAGYFKSIKKKGGEKK